MAMTARCCRNVAAALVFAIVSAPVVQAAPRLAAGGEKVFVLSAREIGGTWNVYDGRWKVDGSGGCYWEPNDSGPDQCSPNTGGGGTGRWKADGVGNCYWDSSDPGPNQCNPDPPPPPPGEPAPEGPIEITSSSGHVTLTPVEIDGSTATIDFRMVYYDNRGGMVAANVTSRRDDLLTVTVRDVELVGPTTRPLRRGPLQRHNGVACEDVQGQNRAFGDEMRGIIKAVVVTSVAASIGCALTTVGYFACVGLAVGGRIAGEFVWAGASYLWDCY